MTREETALTIRRLFRECSSLNWNGYGALPMTNLAVDAALRLAEVLPPPSGVVPLNDGGLEFSWGEDEVALYVGPDGLEDRLGLWANRPELLISLSVEACRLAGRPA